MVKVTKVIGARSIVLQRNGKQRRVQLSLDVVEPGLLLGGGDGIGGTETETHQTIAWFLCKGGADL